MKKVRERLIESATHLFSERGFHAVSVSEITSRAKTNVSLVSFYFGGKNGLLTTLFTTLVETGMKEINGLDKAPTNQTEFKDGLRAYLNQLSAFYIENSELLRIFIQELENGNAEAEKFNNETFGGQWQVLLDYLNNAKANGVITVHDSRALAMQIMSPFHNLIRNRNCTARLIDLTLENEEFRNSLIEQIVQSSSLRLES